jgi:molybdate transport system permease protein
MTNSREKREKPVFDGPSQTSKQLRPFFPGIALLIGFAGVALVFLTMPLLALVIRSLQNSAWDNLPDTGILSAIGLSFVSTFITLVITIIFGTPLAYLLARQRFPFKWLVSVLVELPIVLPPAVAGLALLITYGRRGVLGPVLGQLGISLPFTFAAVVMAQTFVAAPFYIRSAAVGFHGVPREVEDAARVDGAGGWSLFWFVTLPLAFRPLAAGLILCWARALGEFGATILFAGSLQGRTQTMPLLIYNVIERDIDAAIWTGLILVVLALFALLLSQWLTRSTQDENRL